MIFRARIDRWWAGLGASALVIVGIGLTGCTDEPEKPEEPEEPESPNDPDFPGPDLEDLLEPLATPCSYADGVMSIVVEGFETAVVSLSADGRTILVNGLACGDATKFVVTAIDVAEIGDGGSQIVVLDFSNGFFALATADGGGFSVDIGEGADDLMVFGTRSDDSFELGADGLELDGDDDLDVVFAATEAFIASLGPGNDTFTASGGASAGAAVANGVTVYGGAGADDLTGGNGDDTLVGGPGDDRLAGGAGDDELTGELGDDVFAEGRAANGSDVFSGGAGTDTVDYGSRTDFGVTVTIGGEADDGATGQGEGDDVGSDVENVTGSDTLDDVITGSSSDNVLDGGGGDDRLVGGAGDDTLNGGAGDDTFAEGIEASGSDTFNGGAGTDTVDYGGRTDFGVTVTMDGQADDGATGKNEDDDVGPDVENLVGSDFDDVITGNSSGNVLTGGLGDDTLLGAGGDDRFDEGSDANGADTIQGGSGFDFVSYRDRSNDLTITMDGASANDGEAGEGDQIGSDVENVDCGGGDDVVIGNGTDNMINGGAGNDELHGRRGNDLLSGDDGDDTLFGDEGDDVLDGGGGTNALDCGAGSDIALNGSDETCEL